MEQGLPLEELARQRLNVMVYAYSLFIKNLMKEGLDREKVKRASDRVWSTLGAQAAEQMKPILGAATTIGAAQQAGAMASSVHGIETQMEAEESEGKTTFTKCPWQDAAEALALPREWRLCPSGHAAFTETMLKTLNPGITFRLTRSMPDGDASCEDNVSL